MKIKKNTLVSILFCFLLISCYNKPVIKQIIPIDKTNVIEEKKIFPSPIATSNPELIVSTPLPIITASPSIENPIPLPTSNSELIVSTPLPIITASPSIGSNPNTNTSNSVNGTFTRIYIPSKDGGDLIIEKNNSNNSDPKKISGTVGDK
ncbi:MAG: hypothetical protein AABZ74_03975 [Cyanobacteriota bacterium]